MATLTDADIKRPSQREYATALEDDDVFVIEDVSAQKIKPITKPNTKETLGINAKEESSNKKSTLSENSEIYYPNQKAVNDGLATKLDVDSSGNIIPTGIYLGGTGSANYLDDYEVGGWTPTFLSNSGCGVSGISSFARAIYIKIGFFVLVSAFINFDSNITADSPNDYIQLGGFPFAPSGENIGSVGTGAIGASGMHGVISQAGYIWGLNDRIGDTPSLIFTICYKTSQ